jgi:hypothetical protein
MAYKTYLELKTEVFNDLNLQGEVFLTDEEFLAITNRAIDFVEAQIHKFNCDDTYFEACAPLALTANYQDYALPSDIYANKIKKIICQKPDWIYEIKRMKKLGRYLGAAYADLNSSTNIGYEYMIINNSPTVGPRMRLFPKPQETTTQVTCTGIWSTGTSSILVDNAAGIAPGQFVVGPGIPSNSRVISVDTNSLIVIVDSTFTAAGAADSLTFTEDDFLIYYIRNANAVTSNTDKIDIPEFYQFIVQFCKVECLKKELGNVRVSEEKEMLLKIEQQMIDTLAEMTPDEDNEVQADTRFYEEIV